MIFRIKCSFYSYYYFFSYSPSLSLASFCLLPFSFISSSLPRMFHIFCSIHFVFFWRIRGPILSTQDNRLLRLKAFLGSGPDRGQSPIERGDFLFVCPSVRPFVPPLGQIFFPLQDFKKKNGSKVKDASEKWCGNWEARILKTVGMCVQTEA